MKGLIAIRPIWRVTCGLMLAACCLGCERTENRAATVAENRGAENRKPATPGSENGALPENSAVPERPVASAPATAPNPGGYWEVYMMQGSKVGYAHTTVVPIEEAGEKLLKFENLTHLEMTRFGQQTSQEIVNRSVETSSGRVVRIATSTQFGDKPIVTQGKVEGARLVLRGGPTPAVELPWTAETRGFFAVEQSLERVPLKPGQKRRLRMLLPVLNQIVDVELSARNFETTPLLEGQDKLLRIETMTLLTQPAGAKIATTIWTDARGRTLKTSTGGLAQESYRVTREVALAAADKVFDIGNDMIVKIDRSLPGGHQARRVRYLARLEGKDPAEVFASGPTQHVRSLGRGRAEIVVESIRPCQVTGADTAPGADALRSNSTITSDDPKVRAMAEEAARGIKNPCMVAVALEQYVHRAIREKNFTHAFATAAEVATSRQGDCTEHAVLLAAMARAVKIPSRVAMGLVYVQNPRGFGYHMWTEMFLSGVWIPLDATLGQGGIGAGHLKLSDSTLAGDSPYSGFLSVSEALGRLKLEILDAE